jgi:hypothetical protein
VGEKIGCREKKLSKAETGREGEAVEVGKDT